MMMWQCHQLLRDGLRCARFLTLDASPQGGYDYLVCREELMERSIVHAVDRAHPLRGFRWERRTLPIACIGLGRGSAVDKTCKLMWQASLEPGAKLDIWRRQV